MAFPRIFQRLFANSGAGPKLRRDIIPWDEEQRLVALESWRQAMIGTPMPMASTTLPPGFMWADGSFASFATYPELKAKYDAGGFAGMLLAYDAQEADISAYPGKFKPDSANPTGLFVPRLNGLFARYCGGVDGNVGAYHRDEIRNIVGNTTHMHVQPSGAVSAWGGALGTLTDSLSSAQSGTSSIGLQVQFDASRVVPTGPENVPQHYLQPVALYMGRVAQI